MSFSRVLLLSACIKVQHLADFENIPATVFDILEYDIFIYRSMYYASDGTGVRVLFEWDILHHVLYTHDTDRDSSWIITLYDIFFTRNTKGTEIIHGLLMKYSFKGV